MIDGVSEKNMMEKIWMTADKILLERIIQSPMTGLAITRHEMEVPKMTLQDDTSR